MARPAAGRSGPRVGHRAGLRLPVCRGPAVLLGGKVYNMLQAVMTVKVVIVLGFCLAVGIAVRQSGQLVERLQRLRQVRHRPRWSTAATTTVNVVQHWWSEGTLAGGRAEQHRGAGGIRRIRGRRRTGECDLQQLRAGQGLGDGQRRGGHPQRRRRPQHDAQPRRQSVFASTPRTSPLARWWRYILIDQVLVWAPGCFMGMALPALLSMQFAPHSRSAREPKLEPGPRR